MLKISYVILQHNLPAMRSKQVEDYARRCEHKFRLLYPSAAIDVRVAWGASGTGGSVNVWEVDEAGRATRDEDTALYLQHVAEVALHEPPKRFKFMADDGSAPIYGHGDAEGASIYADLLNRGRSRNRFSFAEG